jgi:hypothetical protein
MISLNIYSFQPHQSLIWSFTLIFIVTGADAGWLPGAAAPRSHPESSDRHDRPIELDLHVYLRIVAFAGVPLLVLLTTHYPAIGRYLVSFVQASLEARK